MKKSSSIKAGHISRRHFIRACGLAAVAAGAGPVLLSRVAQAQATTKNGPAKFSLSLDQNWLFGGRASDRLPEPAYSAITLPHCVAKLSWQKWNPADWQDTWVYHRKFPTLEQFKNHRVFVHFDGVTSSAKATFNGVALSENQGAYLPFQYELTQWLGQDTNQLEILVDARWQNAPPEGNPKGTRTVDYLEAGGITRSATLRVVPKIFISDVFAKPVNVLDPNRRVEVACTIDADSIPPKPMAIQVEMRDGDRLVATATKSFTIEEPGQTQLSLTLSDLKTVKLWDIGAPQLYQIVVTLLANGEPLHDYQTRIGLREARFGSDGFFLNGQRLRLFGLNRHEIYPYVGFAMPPRVMRWDAEILRQQFNCNIVRCSHYPQSESFLDACDELGLMVWQETPGWGYLGDEAWKDLVVRDVRGMITRDRNHPSVVIWGVRVNESANDRELYQRTTEIAKSLDDSRPTSGSMTSGSRKNWEKDWQEDVFAFDDYHSAADGSVGVDAPVPGVPYMLAEAVGQYSYGKKGFNNQYRRAGDLLLQTQQALFHAQAHNKAAAYPGCAGVIAWCGFDYASLMNAHNTVKCPGVADIFRIPKLGAAFYQAQTSPLIRPVILPDFYWDFGPQSPRGPGRQAAIFSNCERLKIFLSGKLIASLQPDRIRFPALEYPPFFCDLDLDPAGHPELRIDGYVGNNLLLSRLFSADPGGNQFVLETDDAALIADGADATRLVFKVQDRFGSERAFGTGSVAFELTGPGVIVGDNPFALADSGGVGAVWIKTIPNGIGTIEVAATHSALGKKTVKIEVESDPYQSKV